MKLYIYTYIYIYWFTGDQVLALEGLGFPDLAQRARSAFSNVTGPAEQLVQKTRAVVQITLKVHRTSVRSEESTTNHASLKEKGNMAFRQGHYSEAGLGCCLSRFADRAMAAFWS